MTDPTCATGCGRPSRDAYLCHGCTAKLEKILAEFPAQLRELETTLTRQSNAARGEGKPTKAAEQPLPFDMRAARLVYEIRNEAAGWIRHLCESRKVPVPQFGGQREPRREGPMCSDCRHYSCHLIRLSHAEHLGGTRAMLEWLYGHVKTIRQDEAAGDLFGWAKALRADLASIVDNHEKRYRGPCTAKIHVADVALAVYVDTRVEHLTLQPSTRTCGADIYARHGMERFKCRVCGATYTATERMMWTLASSRELMFTAAFIAAALTDSGKPVKVDRLYRWAKRGKLFAWQQDDLGRDLYRIGDVLDLLDEHENRQRRVAA
jgi:hypothetical protein